MLDLLVIGAGIVGTWIAYEASRRGLLVAVAEQADRPGDGVTGRNSGVLHAGLYYPPDSLKAFHCVRGRALAEEFLRDRHVPFDVCGKLIVTGACPPEETTAREARLIDFKENAEKSGATGLELIKDPGRQYAGALGSLALHSTNTGIVDVPAYLDAVRRAAEREGALFLLKRRFVSGGTGNVVLQGTGGDTEEVQARFIVNASGLHSDETAVAFGLTGYEIRPNRGEYYRLRFPLPYKKLVYPLPPGPGTAHLGVHYTINTAGEAYAGPSSVPADSRSDYRVTTERSVFWKALCESLSVYKETDLETGYAGLRPRLFKNGEPIRDFVIVEEPGSVIHLLGIESPGLTSAPSLARDVVDRLR
ncbi:MAG: FAD-dependent oxidoreductase [Spirochaetia bacterium]|nr:FAD-dependent oxidoreductase [Spirochaetia bacterium]